MIWSRQFFSTNDSFIILREYNGTIRDMHIIHSSDLIILPFDDTISQNRSGSEISDSQCRCVSVPTLQNEVVRSLHLHSGRSSNLSLASNSTLDVHKPRSV